MDCRDLEGKRVAIIDIRVVGPDSEFSLIGLNASGAGII